MSFVVDGSEWEFDGWVLADVGSAIERFLEIVAVSHERGESVQIGDDFQSRPMLEGRDLWTIASAGGILNLRAETVQELAAWLGTASCYLDTGPWPNSFDSQISIDDGPVSDNPDVAWAHHSVRGGIPVGCLSLLRSGRHSTSSAVGMTGIFWIVTEENRLEFWRDAIITTGDNEASLHRYAEHAFPAVYFHERALAGTGRLAGGYLPLRANVRHCLAMLNDHGDWAFQYPPPALRPGEESELRLGALPTNQLIQQRFAGLGMTIAPENPDVFRNRVCREAREIQVGNAQLYCEWHIKLEPHQNRIHVHAPVPSSQGKVIVAIIDEHLPLP